VIPAVDVIKAALAEPILRAPGVDYVDVQARLIQEALVQYGHLPDPGVAAEPDYDAYARLLAEASAFPRFAGANWRCVMESEAHIEVATTHALRRCAGTLDERRVQEARRVLLGRLAGAEVRT
jgi:hypothetical protein